MKFFDINGKEIVVLKTTDNRFKDEDGNEHGCLYDSLRAIEKKKDIIAPWSDRKCVKYAISENLTNEDGFVRSKFMDIFGREWRLNLRDNVLSVDRIMFDQTENLDKMVEKIMENMLMTLGILFHIQDI